jgi:hypothetical protein
MIRGLVKRIKSSWAYTPAIGQQLGVIGPKPAMAAASLEQGGVRPELTLGSVRNGLVEIRFRKDGFTGILVASRRAGESSFTTLGKQIYSPFVDQRPNLAAGPETRNYQAWFLDGDNIAGEASDILVATVPEAGIEAATAA